MLLEYYITVDEFELMSRENVIRSIIYPSCHYPKPSAKYAFMLLETSLMFVEIKRLAMIWTIGIKRNTVLSINSISIISIKISYDDNITKIVDIYILNKWES